MWRSNDLPSMIIASLEQLGLELVRLQKYKGAERVPQQHWLMQLQVGSVLIPLDGLNLLVWLAWNVALGRSHLDLNNLSLGSEKHDDSLTIKV